MRRIRNLYALAILFAFFSNFSNAQNAPSFRIEPASISGSAGDTVTVKVIARNFNKIDALQFSIGWDSTVIKSATNLSVLYATSHRVILESGSGCFAIRDYEVLLAYYDQATVGQTILATEDSTLFSFKVVLKKDVSNASICFSDKITKELSFFDDKGFSQVFVGFATTCGSLLFKPEKLLLCHDGLYREYDDKDTIIKLVVKAYGGLKPYFYDWGKQKGVSKIMFPPPLQDTIINVKVRDAANDTVAIAIKLVKKSTVNFAKVITLSILKGAKQHTLALGVGFDKALYTYDWGSLPVINSIYDTATFSVPELNTIYLVKVTGPQGSTAIYKIEVKVLPFEVGQFYFHRYYVGDTIVTVSLSTSNGMYPFRYLWDNGDTISASKRRVGSEDRCSASVTITDAYGQIASSSASISRDTNAFVRFSDPLNKYNSNNFYFEKNPITGVLRYQARIYVKDQIVFSDSGFTASNNLPLDFINNSYFDTAFVYLTYYLEHEKFPVKEQKIKFVMAPKQAAPLTVEAKNQYYCKLDSSLILKAKVSGGVPPYYYNWGTLGAGYEVDWMPAEPKQSTTYPVTVTDQSGQKQVKEFQISIGEVSIINKVSYSKKELCANSEFTINLDKSLKIENYNGAQYSWSYSFYDKDWNIASKQDRVDDRSRLNFATGNISNVSNTKLIIKVKSIASREFCIDPNGKEFVDTITILPSPAFAVKNAVTDTVCEGSILSIFTPPQDSSNLPNVKYEWSLLDTRDYTAKFMNQPFTNYLVRSKYQFYNSSNLYQLNDFIRQGARLTYTNSGCSTAQDLKHTVVIPRLKFLLKNDNQLISSSAGVVPIEIITNLNKVKYSLSYTNDNLSGSLLEDQSFPLSGVLVNNTTTSHKLGIIVKSSLFGCEGQVDTAFVEVRNGIEENYDFTSSDEMVTQFKSSARKVADDLGADFQYLLSPNPASSELTFSFSAQSSSSASVGIYSISGQQIMDFTFQTQKGLNAFHCSLDRLPAGSYILLFKSAENVKTERFEKL